MCLKGKPVNQIPKRTRKASVAPESCVKSLEGPTMAFQLAEAASSR